MDAKVVSRFDARMDNPTTFSNFELFLAPAGQLITFAADDNLAMALAACGDRLRLSIVGENIVLLSEGSTVLVFLKGAALAWQWPISKLDTYASAMKKDSDTPLWAKKLPWVDSE